MTCTTILNIICLFHCADICTDGTEAVVSTNVSATAWIKAVTPNYTRNHYTCKKIKGTPLENIIAKPVKMIKILN